VDFSLRKAPATFAISFVVCITHYGQQSKAYQSPRFRIAISLSPGKFKVHSGGTPGPLSETRLVPSLPSIPSILSIYTSITGTCKVLYRYRYQVVAGTVPVWQLKPFCSSGSCSASGWPSSPVIECLGQSAAPSFPCSETFTSSSSRSCRTEWQQQRHPTFSLTHTLFEKKSRFACTRRLF